MNALKPLFLAAFATLSLAMVPAMAQNAPTDLNAPVAHRSTTVISPDGRVVHTPPVGMRSGDKNVGGEGGGS